jgi:hypothetical protein
MEIQDSSAETLRHIKRVNELLMNVVVDLIQRGKFHDASKLEGVEKALFDEYTPKLRAATYNSPEYKKFLEDLKPALAHHYAKCRHHPEHYKNGVNDMSIIDVLEMFLDWKASSERQNDGNIRTSLEINSNKFNIDTQLRQILENTINYLGW